MKVISTNYGTVKEVTYRGKTVKTGIFKFPVTEGIFLGNTDVKGDHVVDRRFHGGIDKACYLYSLDFYGFWKERYPNLDWQYGMFGENLTVKGLDERNLNIGNVYQIGDAIVEISQPRQPCFKLGIRMGTPKVLKQFINTSYSGTYVRVLQNGQVNPGDEFKLIESFPDNPTIADAFYTLYQEYLSSTMLDRLLSCDALADSCKKGISARVK